MEGHRQGVCKAPQQRGAREPGFTELCNDACLRDRRAETGKSAPDPSGRGQTTAGREPEFMKAGQKFDSLANG